MSKDKQRRPVSPDGLRMALLQSMARIRLRKQERVADLELAAALKEKRSASPNRAVWQRAFTGHREPTVSELALLVRESEERIAHLESRLSSEVLRGAEAGADHNGDLMILASLVGIDGFLGELKAALGEDFQTGGVPAPHHTKRRPSRTARLYRWVGKRYGLLKPDE